MEKKESKTILTIDEKIQELVDWSARYPKAEVQLMNQPTYILEEYVQSVEELKKLQEQYQKMQKYYVYIRERFSKRKINNFTKKDM